MPLSYTNLLTTSYNSHYLIIYKVTRDHKEAFVMPRHENDVNSHTPPYYWQKGTPNQGWSTEKIYVSLTESESTFSETIKNPKVIDNRKYKQKNCKNISGKQSDAEITVNLFDKKKMLLLNLCNYAKTNIAL